MRRLTLILMILLLPLRTWAGDFMAVQTAQAEMAVQRMVAPSLAASAVDTKTYGEVDAASVDGRMKAAVSDCHGHTPITSDAAAAQPDCSACTTCQICHSVAMAILISELRARDVSLQVPTFGAPGFTSAECALSQKPPIS